MKRIGLLLVVSACGHEAAVDKDCAAVTKDPASAMQALSTKYPGQPVKVAETIEKCVAPTGDECERLAKIIQAIPGMMGTGKATTADSVLATCRGMPDEMKHCMLPSYSLAHGDVCKKMYGEITAVDIKPAPTYCDGGVVSALITRDGVWVGATDGKGCFGKRAGSQLDTAWIEAALKPFVVGCRPSVEIAAAADVPYLEVIEVMDLSTKVGLIDESFAGPDDLTHSSGSAPESAPARCEAVTATGTSKKSPSPPMPPPSAPTSLPITESGHLAELPIIIVTKTEVQYATKRVGNIAEIAKGTGDIEELGSALPAKPSDNRIILQADEATPSSVIVHVVDTAKHAGYGNVIFAVKNK